MPSYIIIILYEIYHRRISTSLMRDYVFPINTMSIRYWLVAWEFMHMWTCEKRLNDEQVRPHITVFRNNQHAPGDLLKFEDCLNSWNFLFPELWYPLRGTKGRVFTVAETYVWPMEMKIKCQRTSLSSCMYKCLTRTPQGNLIKTHIQQMRVTTIREIYSFSTKDTLLEIEECLK